MGRHLDTKCAKSAHSGQKWKKLKIAGKDCQILSEMMEGKLNEKLKSFGCK